MTLEPDNTALLKAALMIAKGHGWDLEAIFERIRNEEKSKEDPVFSSIPEDSLK